MNGMIAATIHGTRERMSRPTPMAKRTLFGLGLSRSMGSSCLTTIRPQNEMGKHCNFLQSNSEHEIAPQTAKTCRTVAPLVTDPQVSDQRCQTAAEHRGALQRSYLLAFPWLQNAHSLLLYRRENNSRNFFFTIFWSDARRRPSFLRTSTLSIVTTLARRTSVGFGSPAFCHSCNTTSDGKLNPPRWLVIMATT